MLLHARSFRGFQPPLCKKVYPKQRAALLKDSTPSKCARFLKKFLRGIGPAIRDLGDTLKSLKSLKSFIAMTFCSFRTFYAYSRFVR